MTRTANRVPFSALAVACCLAQAADAPGAGTPAPPVRAQAAIVVDARGGRVLFEKRADVRWPPASTQKLLTALLVIGAGDLERPLHVARADTLVEPSKLGLRSGDVYSRHQLLHALLVKSGNDVALSLARDNAGSIESFAGKMNALAARLGMRDSHFVNPNGLPAPDQHSTARDLSRLALAAHANPLIRSIVRQRKIVFQYADGRRRTLTNTNSLLELYPYCDGMKTGYTAASGHCLIASASYVDRAAIAVLLGSTSSGVWKDALVLLDWALSNSGGIAPYVQRKPVSPRVSPYTTQFLIE